MKKIEINRQFNEYSLSCIENYLLYLIAEKRSDWSLVFSQSFLPFIQIVKLFEEGQNYSHFKGISRLQKVAGKQGICYLEHLLSDRLPDDIIYNNSFAMQVKSEYMKCKYGKVLWREDHYILFEHFNNTDFCYINNIPLDSGKMEINEMINIYDGCLIKFEVNQLKKLSKSKILSECIANVMNQTEKVDNCKCIEVKQLTLEKLRDAIGVAKVLVKRMETFVKGYDESFCLENYYKYLTCWYLKLEYARLKREHKFYIPDIITEINKEDSLYYRLLLNKLLEIGDKCDGKRIQNVRN